MKKQIILLCAMTALLLTGCGEPEPQIETTAAETLPPFVMTYATEEPTVPETTEETIPPEAFEAVRVTKPQAAEAAVPETQPETTEGSVPETTAPAQEPAETEAPTEPPTEAKVEPDFPVGVIVSTPAVKVREGPTFSTKVVKKIPKNEYVVIYEIVQMNNQYWGRMDDGWISMNYCRLEGEAPEYHPGNGVPALIVNSDSVNVRSEPTVNSEKVDTLYLHDVIRVYEVTTYLNDQWGKLENGWVSMKFVMLPQDPAPLYTDYEPE